MAVITPDTFDPLRRYVSVRLQQGVPLVDADWNEKDDIRRFELQAYLKWFVGDGVPFGSDAFLIAAAAPPLANDFVIAAGVDPAPGGATPLRIGLSHVGRCLVDGMDAVIDADVTFRSQILHVASGGATDAAARMGTTVIPEMAVLDGSLLIYLDVWERLVRPDEDPTLVFVDIGTETTARMRREWAVRTRNGADVPQTGDPDFEAGHAYYALARIARTAAEPTVYASQIEDLREKRLLTPPSTLIDDLLGTTPDRYRRGLDRPAISLRSAVNALLRGQLPSSLDQVIASNPGNDFPTRSIARWGSQLLMLWHTNRVAATNQVFALSWNADTPVDANINTPVQVTSGGAAELPSLALLPTAPDPAIFVAYQTQNDILFRRADNVVGLPAATEDVVSTQPEAEEYPIAVRTGSIVTVFWYWSGPNPNQRIRLRRRQYDPTWSEGGAAWLDGETTDLSTLQPRNPSTVPGVIHAAADSLDRVWVTFRTQGNNIAVARLTTGTGAVETWANIQMDSGGSDEQPFVLVDEPANVWIFWRGDDAIYHRALVLAANTWGTVAQVPGTSGPLNANERPAAMLDQDGGIWLFWSRDEPTAGTDVWAARRDPNTGGWGVPRQVTASTGNNDAAYAIEDGGAISLFFRSNRNGQFDLFYKQLITTI